MASQASYGAGAMTDRLTLTRAFESAGKSEAAE